MSPAQVRTRLDNVSAQVDRAADLVRVGEMAAKTLPAAERDAITELLRAVSDRLDGIAGELHDMPERAA